MQDDHYVGVILEEVRDQNKAVLEAVGSMQGMVKLIPGIKNDIEVIKTDIKAIKAVVKNHEGRITTLETA